MTDVKKDPRADLPRKPKISRTSVERGFSELESTISRWERQRVGYVPNRYILSYKRVVLGVASKTTAIKSYCQQCVGWSELPESVSDCTATLCPLYAYRPYQKQEERRAVKFKLLESEQ